jgi:hypothetical protein
MKSDYHISKREQSLIYEATGGKGEIKTKKG